MRLAGLALAPTTLGQTGNNTSCSFNKILRGNANTSAPRVHTDVGCNCQQRRGGANIGATNGASLNPSKCAAHRHVSLLQRDLNRVDEDLSIFQDRSSVLKPVVSGPPAVLENQAEGPKFDFFPRSLVNRMIWSRNHCGQKNASNLQQVVKVLEPFFCF